MSVPSVPPGTNPYTAYLAALDTLFYPTPTPGFKIRIIVLFVVHGLAIAMACIHLCLYIWDGHRRKSNVFWVFRFVHRTSGGYLVTNTKVVSTVLSIVNLTTFLCYTYNVFDTFYRHAPMTSSFSWRAFPTVCLLIQGWMLSWGLLQAYLLTQEKYHSRGFGARTINVGFILGGVALTAGVLVAAIFMALAGRKLWSEAVALVGALTTLESSWTGSTDVAGMLKLAPALEALNKASTHYNSANIVEFALVGGIAALISLVNVGSILLTRLLRRQIKLKTGQMGQSSGVAHLTEAGVGLRSGEAAAKPTRRSIRAMARASSGADGEMAKQLVVLQKAERDLLYTSAAQIIVAGAASGLCFNIAYQSAKDDILTHWPMLELTTTAVQWLYAVALLIAFTLLNVNTLRSFSSPSHGAVAAESATATESSTLSFGAFFPAPGTGPRRASPFPVRPSLAPMESGLSTPELKEKDEAEGFGVAL